MRELVLTKLTVEGFKSFRKPTTIGFPSTPGLRFLTGDNQVEPKLGANGAGKSAIWDALIWCCYNATGKGRKASDVVSWGEKRISVSSEWIVIEGEQDSTFTITRTSGPNRLTVDGAPSEQYQIDALLGMSYDCFLQSVVFGQGNQTFYDFNSAGRSELLDEVLDIKLWLDASETASAQCRALDKKLAAQSVHVAQISGRLDGLEPESTFQELVDEWRENQEQKLDAAIADVETATNEHESMRALLAQNEITFAQTKHEYLEIQKSINADKHALQDRINKLREKNGSLTANMAKLSKDLTNYSRDGACPSCGNYLKPEDRKRKWAAASAEYKTHEAAFRAAGSAIDEYTRKQSDLTQKWSKLSAELSTSEKPLIELQYRVRMLDEQLKKLIATAEAIADEHENPHTAALKENKARRRQLGIDLVDATTASTKLRTEIDMVTFWRDGFKRVRLWLMKQVLTVLEFEVSAAAATLGLPGWTITFATEVENKSGALKPGIHIRVSSPHIGGVWADQSGGEEQRVRLAVALGFSAVVQRMAGVWHYLEVWDEPSNWLSEQGIEDLLECLSYRAQTTGRTVWVVDHRTLGSGSFIESWCVTKDKAGSRIKTLAGE